MYLIVTSFCYNIHVQRESWTKQQCLVVYTSRSKKKKVSKRIVVKSICNQLATRIFSLLILIFNHLIILRLKFDVISFV